MAERRITGQVNNPGRALGSAPDFTSSDQTVTADTALDVAHGLGAVPTLWMLTLKCTTADLNYSAGDEFNFIGTLATNANSDRGASAFGDATNITVIQGQTITALDKTGFNTGAITVTSWRWVVRAWR